jgi:two-component system nitrogen regulation sensor histidine kinase GlnL
VHVGSSNRHQQTIVEMLQEQQAKQDREERLMDQAQANKELILSPAHEIQNPLGEFEVLPSCCRWKWQGADRIHTEWHSPEADRLQTLVDRLLAPRKATS